MVLLMMLGRNVWQSGSSDDFRFPSHPFLFGFSRPNSFLKVPESVKQRRAVCGWFTEASTSPANLHKE
jgi:hypothetical protein